MPKECGLFVEFCLQKQWIVRVADTGLSASRTLDCQHHVHWTVSVTYTGLSAIRLSQWPPCVLEERHEVQGNAGRRPVFPNVLRICQISVLDA